MYNHSCDWCCQELVQYFKSPDLHGVCEEMNLKILKLTLKSEVWGGSMGSGGHSTESKSGPLQNKPGKEADHAWLCDLCEEIWSLF